MITDFLGSAQRFNSPAHRSLELERTPAGNCGAHAGQIRMRMAKTRYMQPVVALHRQAPRTLGCAPGQFRMENHKKC